MLLAAGLAPNRALSIWAVCALLALGLWLTGAPRLAPGLQASQAAAGAQSQVLVLQAGTVDAYMDAQAPDAAQGQDSPDSLRLRRASQHSLLKFDLSTLPPGAQVQSATLSLFALGSATPFPTIEIELYQLLTHWTDVQVTWNSRQPGQSWDGPGCTGAGTDRVGAAVSKQSILGGNRWHDFDATAAVRAWVSGEAINEGLLLAPSAVSAWTAYTFRSANWHDATQRPKLTVTYGVETTTPSATAPIATATSSPALTTPTTMPSATVSSSPTMAAPSATSTASRTPTSTLVPGTWRTPVSDGLYAYAEQRIGFVGFNLLGKDVRGLHSGLAKLEDRGPTTYERSLGLDYLTVFQVHFWKYDQPDRATYQAKIRAHVTSNPGYLWFIGNEPEAICRGNRSPGEYIIIYHDMYELIKGVDPTAKVGIGGVVLPSVYRLRWLTQVLDEYKRRYGVPLPIDVWSVHNLLLSECPGSCGCVDVNLCKTTCCSGGYKPVGQQGNCLERTYRSPTEQANVETFKQLIWDFRRWMATREEARGKELILTEMGVFANHIVEGGALYPREPINQFMADAFDFLLAAADPAIGCTSDGGRLVQRWTWYSLDHTFCDCPDDLNGSLFQGSRITDFGVSFANYTARFLPTLPIRMFFEKGWSGYRADADTTITAPSSGNPAINFIKIQADGTRQALLKFELPELPATVEVVSATLSLRSLAHVGIGSMPIECYGIKRPWDVATATWTNATSNTAWQQPGCAGPDDRELVPSSIVTVTTDGTTYAWDITDLARRWVSDPVSNQGVLLAARATGTGYWTFVSSNQTENPQAGAEWTYRGRPRLDLSLRQRVEAQTPTPTATPESTASPTFTPTASATPTPTDVLPGTPTVMATSTRAPTSSVTVTPTAPSTATRTETSTPTRVAHSVYLPCIVREKVAPFTSRYYLSANQRFGAGLSTGTKVNGRPAMITDYDIGSLGIGWYSDWTAHAEPLRPGGIRYAQLYAVRATAYPTNTLGLTATVSANRGALWIVGNEPEGMYGQGKRTPAEYAQIYHYFYTLIKAIDSTAYVAIGGVIQPTPLRLQWLDMVLSEYRARFGQEMPVDVWNTHMQILQEQADNWGAGIPAGLDARQGRLYEFSDNADPLVFQQLIVELRQWMKARGYQNKPLIVSEYGVLMPSDYLADDVATGDQIVIDFMRSTFDFMLGAKDPSLGYPADDNRLVQQWLWYSLNDQPYDPVTGMGFNGSLFSDQDPTRLTQFGVAFRDYMQRLLGLAQPVVHGAAPLALTR